MRGGRAEAWIDDVVQESLVDVLRGVAACRAGSEAELMAWVATIARRQVATHFRREARWLEATVPLATYPQIPEPDSPEPPPTLQSLLAGLEDALTDLTGAQSCLLWLRIQTHATWPEVGDELGIPATAAKRRWQRLAAMLRRRCACAPDCARATACAPGSETH